DHRGKWRAIHPDRGRAAEFPRLVARGRPAGYVAAGNHAGAGDAGTVDARTRRDVLASLNGEAQPVGHNAPGAGMDDLSAAAVYDRRRRDAPYGGPPSRDREQLRRAGTWRPRRVSSSKRVFYVLERADGRRIARTADRLRQPGQFSSVQDEFA